MQIKLSDSGPPMWFLGKPKEIKMSLTFAEPGPIEVNFEKLNTQEQKQILVGLKQEILEADVDFQELYKVWVQDKPAISPPTPEVKKYIETVKKDKQENQRMKLEAQRKKKEKKFQERCAFLHKKSLRALRSTLKGEKDSRLFRVLLTMENARRRPRVSHRDYFQERLRSFQEEVVLNIEKQTADNPVATEPKETLGYSVIDSEQELVCFAAGEPLQE